MTKGDNHNVTSNTSFKSVIDRHEDADDENSYGEFALSPEGSAYLFPVIIFLLLLFLQLFL